MDAWSSAPTTGGMGSGINPLASGGDAHFFEESIHPNTVRSYFLNSDPGSPRDVPQLSRGMKWLLATMSKGRDVSDFFPHVVKLTGASSLEVRKMVYMYLVHYADHDATCRELALLSINSFQRGLADAEQLIRGLALRALSSVRVPEIVQIQILGVQTASRDRSPYVRKCAANALSKLAPYCDVEQRRVLLDLLRNLLDTDSSTMVLSSAVIAFAELCPHDLDVLHGSYRKLCHLMTDMDEWGQVVLMDTLARYCRKNFTRPGEGSAEAIDRKKMLRRSGAGDVSYPPPNSDASPIPGPTANGGASAAATADGSGDNVFDAHIPTPRSSSQRNVLAKPQTTTTTTKRRVVRKAFYSDEEDESTEEEISVTPTLPRADMNGGGFKMNALNAPDTFGGGAGGAGGGVAGHNMADEDEHLDEDHRLLLRSSLPLLKSRNAAVVLAVCSLHYYCGVSSVKNRSALGKALVRIHRDKREIQYVVLTSIKTLVRRCPSAFTPFLNDFFVKAMDPSFTRMIKLDILAMLALEPASVSAVLQELRTYVRHNDKEFVRSSIRTVGKISELARHVHLKRAEADGQIEQGRKRADEVALNCLFGLMTLISCSRNELVVGECVVTARIIAQRLSSASVGGQGGAWPPNSNSVYDPNNIQSMATRRLLLLLLRSLAPTEVDSVLLKESDGAEEAMVDGEEGEKGETEKHLLPPEAIAASLWFVGEWLVEPSVYGGKHHSSLLGCKHGEVDRATEEIVRLTAKSFVDLDPIVKLHSVHFASKIILSKKDRKHEKEGRATIDLCEHILGLGRLDVHPDVRDRARFESSVLQMIGNTSMATGENGNDRLSLDDARRMIIDRKPPSSSLPLDDAYSNENETFQFGTLSSLVGHRAGGTYYPLPPWADRNSASSLRDPPTSKEASPHDLEQQQKIFYGEEVISSTEQSSGESDSDESSDEESSDDDSSSGTDEDSSSGTDEDSSDDEDSSSSDESDSESSDASTGRGEPAVNDAGLMGNVGAQSHDSTSSNDTSDASSDESSYESDESPPARMAVGNLLSLATPPRNEPRASDGTRKDASPTGKKGPGQGLEGLVMAPIVLDAADAEVQKGDVEDESSCWKRLIRPELGGGLSVKARFLRGGSAANEAKLLSLDTSALCVQLKFENRRNDYGVLRRVRVVQRSSGSGAPRQVVVRQEIAALGKDQVSIATLGLDFGRPQSDRDGAWVARFDVKSDRGTNPIEIRPPLGELLRPRPMTSSEFEKVAAKLNGVYQRTSCSFSLSAGLTSRQSLCEEIPERIVKNAYLSPVDNEMGFVEGVCRFTGALPFSGDSVLVSVKCDSQTGTGEITIFCDNALASNSLMDSLKRAVVECE